MPITITKPGRPTPTCVYRGACAKCGCEWTVTMRPPATTEEVVTGRTAPDAPTVSRKYDPRDREYYYQMECPHCRNSTGLTAVSVEPKSYSAPVPAGDYEPND